MCRALATSSLPVPLSPVIEHRGGGRRDLAELGHDRVHGRRVADDPLEAELLVELLLQLDVGALEPLRLRRLVGHGSQLVDIERLGQVGRGAGLHGGDGRLDRAVAGQDHDLGVGKLALGLGQDLEPADPVHDQVGDDDVEDLLFDQPQALAAAGGDDAVVADPLETLGHGRGVRFVVVDHQDADLLVHRPIARGRLCWREISGLLWQARAWRSFVSERAARTGGPRLAHREPDGELRPLAGLALHLDRAAVGLDDLAGRRQSQAAPRRPGRKEGVEDPGANLLGHSHAGVDHVEHDPGPVAPGRQDQLAAGGHGVLGVQDQVQEGLLEQVGIDPGRGQVGREVGADHDPLGRRVRLVEVAELIDDRVQVGRLELQVLHPGEPEEVLEDVAEPMDLVLQPFDPLQHAAIARGLGVLKVLGQQVEVQRERRERVANLMREPAGKLGDLGVLGAEPPGDFRFFVGRGGALARGSPAGDEAPAARRRGSRRRRSIPTERAVPPVDSSWASETVLGRRFAMRDLRRLPEVGPGGSTRAAAEPSPGASGPGSRGPIGRSRSPGPPRAAAVAAIAADPGRDHGRPRWDGAAAVRRRVRAGRRHRSGAGRVRPASSST